MSFAPQIPILQVSGKDALSFLHRMSTQDFENSKPCEKPAAFLNQKGRMISLVHAQVLSAEETRLHLCGGSAQSLLEWLSQFCFIDEVTLTDISTPCLLSEAQRAEAETQRIHSFKPIAPNEINESVTPLDLGLLDAISWHKGCYIGQEVISRLESQNKVKSQLVGLKVTQADWPSLKAGQSLQTADGQLGQITSVAPLFLPNGIHALAIIKRTPDLPKSASVTETNITCDICVDSLVKDV